MDAATLSAPPPSTHKSEPVSAPAVEPIHAGVVIFDHEGAAESGWACLAGGHPFRIKSPFTLPGDTVWWSNSAYRSVANRLPRHVRHADYLKVPLRRAIAELSLSGERPETIAETLAQILTNTLSIAARALPPNPDIGLTEPYLYQEFLPIAGHAPIIPDAIMKKISMSAWEPWTQITDDRPEDCVTFRQPRLGYALSLLDADVPADDVTQQHPQLENPLDHIRRSLAPCFAEFSIQRSMPAPSKLFGLAATGRRGSNVQKTLASHPELLALSNFAELNVRGVWSGNSYRKLHEFVPASVLDLLRSTDAQFSWSLSIVADAVIRALMAPRPVPGRQRKAMTWRGFWLRSADKVAMFALAMQVSRAGYQPASYGYGWLRVRRPETATAMSGLVSTTLRLGLIPDHGTILPDIVKEVVSGRYGPAAPSEGWGTATFAAHVALHNCAQVARIADDLPLLAGAARERRRAELRQALGYAGSAGKRH